MDKIKSQTLFNLWKQMRKQIRDEEESPKKALINFFDRCISDSKQITDELENEKE